MQQTIQDMLGERFGFTAFREGQEAVITRLVAGKSVLSIFPTGGGKSLCYQLPALALDGLTLVISPLIALMKDQLDFLERHHVPAARLDSTLSREENLALYDALHAGQLKMLYISPERLSNERFLKTLERLNIGLLAVDEAHCISEWGHNFRPDYLKIARLARQLRIPRVLALTATATPAVARDIEKAFGVDPADTINTGFYRPNLQLQVTPCTAEERDGVLLSRIKDRLAGPTIVYVTLQRTAETVAERLCAAGLPAMAYHAGMKPDDRMAVQNAFMASKDKIIVATIAFGMGVDKKDIRYIYHYNLPKGLESYSQEIGRAGRDGQGSICELLACRDDVVVLENFSYGDTPDPEALAGLVQEVLGRGDTFDISEYDLSVRYDIRSLVVRTLMTYLELQDVLVSTGPFYTQYKFKPLKSSAEILARVSGERAEFLRRLFQQAKKGKTWYSLDADRASVTLGEPRDRIVAALGYLEEVGDLEVQAAGIRQGYRVKQRPEDMEALCEVLNERFQVREQHDIDRVRRMLAYAEHKDCLTGYLLDYFGERHQECGHCCRCEGKQVAPLPAPSGNGIDQISASQLISLQEQGNGALQRPRQLTRFLCGIASPAATRAKLKGHYLFGEYQQTPFKEVLDHVGRLIAKARD